MTAGGTTLCHGSVVIRLDFTLRGQATAVSPASAIAESTGFNLGLQNDPGAQRCRAAKRSASLAAPS